MADSKKEELAQFLRNCGVEDDLIDVYVSKFTENCIKTTDIHLLTDNQFQKMEIMKIGHRNRIREQGKRCLKMAIKRPPSSSSVENVDLITKKQHLNVENDPSKSQDSATTCSSVELPLTRKLHTRIYEGIKTTFEHEEFAKDKINAALWTLCAVLPEFSALELQYTDLLDKISLVALRNRIEFLEVRFMIGDKDVDELMKELRADKSELEQISAKLIAKINKTTTLAELSTTTANIIYQSAAKFHKQGTSSNETPLSAPIVQKSSSHYFRWKYAFKYCQHLSDLMKIKRYVESHMTEEEFFIEVAYLFTASSNIGIHVAVPYVGKENVKRSLKMYSMNEPLVLTTVDALYCTLV